ncbi:MAG TPA: Ig-like domain-containing protein [Burkholderiales bacterium]|nr:Ig-like domain-containing protein [Burkholderiales bacterium]
MGVTVNAVSDRAFKFPSSGATLSGVIAYGGVEVVGSNITKVVFFLDGTLIKTETAAPWQAGFDTTTFSNGAHQLQADITGTNGVIERIAIPVTISNTGPAPTNQAPVVNAGSDLTVTLPNSANLTGSATDDALPNPPAALTITWSKLSGPGTVTFGNAASAQTTASFSQSGSYVLRLTASDSALTTSDDVNVTVNPAPATNQAPVVNAGSDLTVTLPNSVLLQGGATDDGLPNPPATLTYSWTKVSGSGSVTFGTPTSPTTTASFSTSAKGTFVLRLTVSDGALTASDDVSVTVIPCVKVKGKCQ